MKDAPAPTGGHSFEAEHLLQAILSMEKQADGISAKLGPFDKQGATLPQKELSNLRGGLKRIAARVGVCTALAERINIQPEAPAEASVADGSGPKAIITPEDEMFPLEGFSDNLTGLPSRLIAEKAFQSALTVGRPRFAAVFCLDRICHTSNRYGADVGNQALRHCAQFLIQRLPPDSLLFRWRGSAFAILFDSSGTPSEAKLLMEQISIQKQKFNFMTNQRSAMVNLTVSFLTLPLAETATAESVSTAIDHFVESHSGRQPH